MQDLIFATNNPNKVEEVKKILNGIFNVISLKEAGIDIDIPEPHQTLEENASEKSSCIHNLTGKNCFSEDTGLEVYALNGEPGVKSARYAGENSNAQMNTLKLLHTLKGTQNRSARFRTIISLIINQKEYRFEGVCEGKIADHESGKNGFGYDSVFIPNGSDKHFAEMSMAEKNLFSHRKKAVALLIKFLQENHEQN